MIPVKAENLCISVELCLHLMLVDIHLLHDSFSLYVQCSPLKRPSMVNHQMINLRQICPDNRPTRFNDPKMAEQTLAV